jgi:hypothetical protein
MAWILGRRARPLGTRAIPCAGQLYLQGSARDDFNQPIPDYIQFVGRLLIRGIGASDTWKK